MTTPTSLDKDLASRFDVIDSELRSGLGIVVGLTQLQSSECIQPGVLTDLGLPMGREGTSIHLVEVMHFLHTADRHGIDLLREFNRLLYRRSEKKEQNESLLADTNNQLDQAAADSDEFLSIALSAVERLRATRLEPGQSSKELADELEKIEVFCQGADATHRMLHQARDIAEGRPSKQTLLVSRPGSGATTVQMMSGSELMELIGRPTSPEQPESSL